jgi:hypothetical protein
MDLITQYCRRANRAEAKAIDGLDFDSGLALGKRHQSLNPSRLARFGTAEFEYGPGFRFLAEVMVEADHPINLGAGEIERLRNLAHRILADMTEQLLHVMQDREERPLPSFMFGQYVSDGHRQ